MSKINVKFLTDEALATIKANLDKFTKIVKENPSDSSSFIAEIIFLIQRNQEKPILQGLQRLWEVVRCAGISMECNTYATSMQQIYQ